MVKMMADIQISVLMSCYINDKPDYLCEALNSIVNQYNLPFELVIVLDGPIDQELFKIIDRYIYKLKANGVICKIIPLPVNVGLGKALGVGAKYCSGDFIMRMDSDDKSRPNRIQFVSKFLAKNSEVDVLGAQILESDFKSSSIQRLRPLPIGKTDIYSFSRLRNPINHVTAVIRRSAYDAVGGYEDVKYFEDYFLWLKFIDNDFCIVNVPEVLVDVRTEGFSDRRRGFAYLSHEIAFVKKAYERGFFNMFTVLKFIVTRAPTRLLPEPVFLALMKKLRRGLK